MISTAPIRHRAPARPRTHLRLVPPPAPARPALPSPPLRARAGAAFASGLTAGLLAVAAVSLAADPAQAGLHACLASACAAVAAGFLGRTRAWARRRAQIRT